MLTTKTASLTFSGFCMLVVRISALALLLAAGNGSLAAAQSASSSDTVTDRELGDELIVRVERDQEARWTLIEWTQVHGTDGRVIESLLSPEDREIFARLDGAVTDIDARNTIRLQEIVDETGWPTYSQVGIDAGDAAWLLVQHADANPEFQRSCLDLMTALPRDEMSQVNLAYLTDRVLLAEGKPQVYGSQFVVRDGKWVPLRLGDEENVDARRAEVGMPPLAEYAAELTKMMNGETGQ